MKSKFWTTNGSDVWILKKQEVFVFTNRETNEVVTCNCVSEVMAAKLQPIKKMKVKEPVEKTSRSKYKGVYKSGRKFKAIKKQKYLGMFGSELLAAAAVQEAMGNHQEAKILLNEYQEGDDGQADSPGQFPSEQ